MTTWGAIAMATSKPISTISYNTEGFLREKLDDWVKAHIIQAYQYICHKGEDGDKDHIHLRVEPNKSLDVMTLTEELREYPVGALKPLGVRPWRPSKEEDWLLYAIHDTTYLKRKYGTDGEKGEKLPYSVSDVRVSELYDIDTMYIRAKATLDHTTVSMATQLLDGKKAVDLILAGENAFAVNAVATAVKSSDYERLVEEHSRLQCRYADLLSALSEIGITIEEDNKGNIIIVKND